MKRVPQCFVNVLLPLVMDPQLNVRDVLFTNPSFEFLRILASHFCPVHEEDESSASVVSSGVFNHDCCIHDVVKKYPKTIKLYDRTRKHKLKVRCRPSPTFVHTSFLFSCDYLMTILFSIWI